MSSCATAVVVACSSCSSLAGVRAWLDGQGWAVRGEMDSPITGGDGAVEFLLWAEKDA